MREKKFTPGPWGIGFSDESGMETIRQLGDISTKSVAVIRWGCGCCKSTDEINTEEKANAHLIAAAPDLLEALEKMCLTCLEKDWMDFQDRKDQEDLCKTCMVSKAIKKAYGE